MKIKIILKSGASVTIECTAFNFEQNIFGITSYSIEGITKNKPLFLDTSQIAAIVREYD